MEKSKKFLYTGLVATVIIMSLNIKLVQYYESRHFKDIMEKQEKSQVRQVCHDIFEIGSRRSNMSEMTDLGVRTILRAKRKKTFLRNLYYEVLAYEAPSMVRKTAPRRGLSGSNVTIAEKWRFQQEEGQFAHMSCRLREYGPEEVRECTAKRRKTTKGTTHLLYIGDSRIRQHVEVMLDQLRDLDLKITTYKGEVLSVEDLLGEKGMKQWNKYKHNFRVESRKEPGFIIDFNWAAIIDWGDEPKSLSETLPYQIRKMIPEKEANKILQNTIFKKKTTSKFKSNKKHRIESNMMNGSVNGSSDMQQMLNVNSKPFHSKKKVNTTNMKSDDFHNITGITRIGAYDILSRINSAPEESLPDVVFLDSGVWLLDEDYITALEHIDFATVVVAKALNPLLKRLAKRTDVVWIAPDPLKEHIQHFFDVRGIYTHQTNTFMEWVLNGQAHLQPPGVLFWDSFLPIAFAADQDCMHLRSQDIDFSQVPNYYVFDKPISWHCLDRYHIGFEALSVAVQMALNHMCNPYLDDSYCCSNVFRT